MNEAMWKSFLAEYNRELLSYEDVVEGLPREVLSAGWLGFSGATEEEIGVTEKRLATQLPPSYRAFLKSSNGWRFPSVFIPSLFQAEKVAWFREQNQDWIDAYADPAGEVPPISDKEYLVYGEKQDCVKFRWEYMQDALQVSEAWDGAVVLLNPKIVSPDGEWEAWLFANWLPGAKRFCSFGEWLKVERAFCQKQLKVLPKSEVKKLVSAKKPRSVRKAAEAARHGQTELAVESLEAFLAKGDVGAAASLAEIYAYSGHWSEVIANTGRALANVPQLSTGNVFADMVKLLGLAGQRSGNWQQVIDVVQAALKADSGPIEKIFQNLIEYAKRQGGPPHELVAIFGVPNPSASKVGYANAVKIAESIPYLKTPQAKAEHVFAVIKNESEDEALKLYEEHGSKFLMAWEAAEYVARVYVRRGKPDAAWAAIQSNLAKWWPMGLTQVAPVVLLTDEYLNTLMTPERCRLVLATPRGPEALKKDQ